MPHPIDNGRRRDAAIVILLLAVFLLASPFFFWWATPGRSWWLPYGVWGGVILLTWLVQRLRSHGL